MKLAIIGEFSGRVRDAFRRRGHDAVSFDLLPSESDGPHVVGDVRDQDLGGFDGFICFPPCTYLCNSGVRWLYSKEGTFNLDRWEKMEEATWFFLWCLDLPGLVCCENPVMHKWAKERVRCSPTQIIHPWQFGHGETKATCLWLRGFPPLQPTNIVQGRHGRVHREPPGPDRWKRRSVTYQGIADAMAEQWGGVG